MKKITHFNYFILIRCYILLLVLAPKFVYAQETKTGDYRNLNAYVSDFSKNELFVKKSMNDYSNSIIENQAQSRSKMTASKMIEKLKAINSNLKANDKGYENNTLLRDSFIKMNDITITCLNDGTFIMDDYELQSLNTIVAITKNFNQRQINLASYFKELRSFEESKKQFGLLFNINIKNFTGKNIFEYNALENVLFYKINVIDEKLNASIIKINKVDFLESILALENMNKEVILNLNGNKNNFNDKTLNNANIAFSKFILTQKSKIIPLFDLFSTNYIILQKLKDSKEEQTNETITTYNLAVKTYNLSKNELFDVMDVIQKNKKIMFDNWFIIDRAFLKNNTKEFDLYQSYTYND